MKKIIFMSCFLTAMTFAGAQAQTIDPTDATEVGEAAEVADAPGVAEVAEAPEAAEAAEAPEAAEKAEAPESPND